MNRNIGWALFGLLAFVVIAIFGLVIFGIFSFQRATTQALAPVQQANQHLQTQVSDLLHPTPTIIPDPITIINDIKSLARLETIQYTVEKVITAETAQGEFGFLFGDKLLFVAHGTVIAGIDMSKITPQDMRLDGKVLHVTLPQPEVFVATLDNNKSYVYDRQTGILRQQQVDLETQARQVAEQEITKAALQDGILKTAGENAETFLRSFFDNLGYHQVEFTYAGGPPAAGATVIPGE